MYNEYIHLVTFSDPRDCARDLVSILKATCEEEDTCVSYEEEDTRSCVHSEGDL